MPSGLFTFDEAVRDYLPARHRHGHLRQLMLALEHRSEGRQTDLSDPLRRVAELARKRGLFVLLSDLLTPLDGLELGLARLTAAGHEVMVFQTLDPAELAFAFQQPMLFQDLESGQDVYVDPEASRADYQHRLDGSLPPGRSHLPETGRDVSSPGDGSAARTGLVRFSPQPPSP